MNFFGFNITRHAETTDSVVTDSRERRDSINGDNSDDLRLGRPSLPDGIPAIPVIPGSPVYYNISGMVRKIINKPAQDMVRRWFDLEISIDSNPKDSKIEKAIEHAIMSRLDDLDARAKIAELIIESRISDNGALMFLLLKGAKIEEVNLNSQVTEDSIESVEAINIVKHPVFSYSKITDDATSINYDLHKFTVSGLDVDKSRCYWMVRNYDRTLNRGYSVISDIVLSIVAHSSTLEAAAKMANELFTKIWYSDERMSPEQETDIMSGIKKRMSIWSILKLKKDERLERPTLNVTGLKELFDFVWQNISAVADPMIPMSILIGNQQGKITGSSNDQTTYQDEILSAQILYPQPAIEMLIRYIIAESNGPVRRIAGDAWKDIKFKLKWVPLFDMDKKTEAEIKKLRAEELKTYVEAGAISGMDIRDREFSDLENYEPEEHNEED